MNASRAPWVEIGSFDVSEGADGDLFDRLPQRVAWRGVFACRLCFRTFEELDNFRHGFNLETLLNEAFDRLRLFLETQHYPGEPEPGFIPLQRRRAVALRCSNAAEADYLTMLILARVCGANEDETYYNALQACREICSIFPYDYRLIPIEAGEEFRRLTGWDFINALNAPEQIAGIERFEGIVDVGQERVYLAGAWKPSLAGNEQIWRMLAGMETPAIYNATLQPVVIPPDELAALQNLCKLLAQAAPQVTSSQVREFLELALQRSEALLKNGRRAYLGQARLMSAAPLPEYAPRAVGFALTRAAEDQPATPGFQITFPQDNGDLQRWKNQALWLAPIPTTEAADRRYVWPRELLLLDEALALFRPPYPLKTILPGMRLDIRKED